MCVLYYIIVVHNAALNSSDNLLSYSPDNHYSSDDVYWRGGAVYFHFQNSRHASIIIFMSVCHCAFVHAH